VEVITGRKVIGLDGDTQVRLSKLDDGPLWRLTVFW
jgi:hypothetical protein